MIVLIRRTLLCFFLLLFCAPLVDLKSQTPANKKTAVGSVSGMVTIKGKGAAGISVSLRNPNGGDPRALNYQAKTDQDGHYRIANVAPGSYQVSPDAPAFVVSTSGSGVVIIAEGESVDEMNFSLTKGGVITGRITDSEGQPLFEIGVSLQPLDSNIQNVRMMRSFADTVSTDDRGIYRIFGLPQGKYKIFVGQGVGNLSLRASRRGSIRQTFYPGVSDGTKAAVIDLSEGSEAANIDIAVDTNDDNAHGYSLSGRIVDAVSGQPVSNVEVGLQRISENHRESTSGGLTSDNLGQFKIEGLAPGKYGIFPVSPPLSDLRADMVTLDIVDHDVDGVVIKMLKGASISGQIVFEGDEKSVRMRPGQLMLAANVQPSTSGYGRSVRVGQDLTFHLSGLQEGNVNFAVFTSVSGRYQNMAISRVELNGVMQPTSIDIKDGEQIAGLKIFINYSTGTIRGIVKAQNGELSPTAQISLWLSKAGADPTRPQPLPPPIIDSRGHFVIEGVAAGSYEINVNVYIPGKRVPMVKQQVSVSDGAVTEVTIPIDLSPDPGPL